jgi:hypothetical protein
MGYAALDKRASAPIAAPAAAASADQPAALEGIN